MLAKRVNLTAIRSGESEDAMDKAMLDDSIYINRQHMASEMVSDEICILR